VELAAPAQVRDRRLQQRQRCARHQRLRRHVGTVGERVQHQLLHRRVGQLHALDGERAGRAAGTAEPGREALVEVGRSRQVEAVQPRGQHHVDRALGQHPSLHRLLVVADQLGRIPQEVGGRGGQLVPVVVPAHLALLGRISVEPLGVDLAPSVLGCADREVQRDEVHRADAAAGELGRMAAGAGDLHGGAGRRLPPGLHPEGVRELGRLVVRDRGARVSARHEAGVGRAELEHL
jgi:hypothetical protein